MADFIQKSKEGGSNHNPTLYPWYPNRSQVSPERGGATKSLTCNEHNTQWNTCDWNTLTWSQYEKCTNNVPITQGNFLTGLICMKQYIHQKEVGLY